MSGSPRRVVVLANRLPYPVDDGWKSRTYHLLRGMARNSAVTLVTFHDGTIEAVERLRTSVQGDLQVVTAGPERRHNAARLLLGLLTPTPVYVWNMRSARFAAELRRVVSQERPDVVVSELTYMAPYLRELPPGVLRVIDTHNIDSVVLHRYAATLPGVARRFYARMTAGKLRRFERRVFTEVDQVWVCSEPEVGLAAEIAPRARLRVIPNGVDTRMLQPQADTAPAADRLLFFGRMDYAPNRDAVEHFTREILPQLRSARPRLELHVVGAGIDEALRRAVGDTPGVRLIGRVEDLRPVVHAAAVVVVPLRMGGGTRLKILEAMSLGRPIVSTSIGAEGLQVRSGQELLLADEPTDFAAAVLSILADPALAAALGSTARQTAIRLYDWSRIEQQAVASLRGREARPRKE